MILSEKETTVIKDLQTQEQCCVEKLWRIMDRQSSMQYLEVVVSECCGICLVMSGKGIKMHFFMEEYGGLVIAVLAVIVMTGILFGLFSQGGYLYEMISRAQGALG